MRHHAYLARRYVDIAEQQVGERRARQAVDQGRASRDRVLLEARSAEVTRARSDADQAKGEAEQARTAADAARAQVLSAAAAADKLCGDLAALQAQQTDSQGSDAYNLGLSERRAQAVRLVMTGRGIDGTRIRARGLGERHPVASNTDASGRQRNRRVEIVFSDANGEFSPAANR